MDENQDSQNSEQPKSYINKGSGEKVLQPSEELLNEIKNNQATQSSPITPPAVPTTNVAEPLSQDSSVLTQANIPPARPNPSSIYPEPTKGFGVSASPVSQSISNNTSESIGEPGHKYKKQITNVIIIALGLYIALISLSGLISGIRTASLGIAGGGDVIYTIDIVYLVLGLGIIFKKELARIIYILLAIIGLLISIYSTYHYFKIDKPVIDNQYSKIVSGDEKTIQNYESNSAIHVSQSTQIVQELQSQLAQDKKQQQSFDQAQNKANKKIVISFIEGYALAVIPLIILTRPKVKEEFS